MPPYAYMVSPDDNSLTIIDIEDLTAPTFAANITGIGAPNYLQYVSGIFAVGDYVYIAATDDNALTIINISNPLAPVFAGSIQGAGAPNFLGGARGVFRFPIVVPTVQTDPATGVT